MNLHVGSGTHPSDIPGWVDLDLCVNAETRPTVAGSAFKMPFPDGTFDRIYMGHLLEHLRWEDELLEGLEEVRRVARPGAEVMTVGPAMEKAVATGQPAWLLDAIISEAPAKDSSGHQWVATEGLTVRALERGGMKNVRAVDVATIMKPQWPNVSQAPWQCAVWCTT